MAALSPVALLLACWTVTVWGAAVALSLPGAFDLVPLFMRREGIATPIFTSGGALWLVTALAVYVAADRATRAALPRFRLLACDVEAAARRVAVAHGVLLTILATWLAVAAAGAGGPGALVSLALSDPGAARSALLEAKLFPGMRLAYAALPATGAFAAALLPLSPDPRTRRLCLSLTLSAVLALAILTVVLSQRLLLLQLLSSAWIGASLAAHKPARLRWIAMAAATFALGWAAREALTNPTVPTAGLPAAAQKLAFYLVNDLSNSLAPLAREIRHTFGAETFGGLTHLTLSTGEVDALLAPRLDALAPVRGGGEFSLLTAPYVDFGAAGGAATVAAFACAARLVYHRAPGHPGWAAAYGQVGGALLISSHSAYLAHHNLLVSLALIAALSPTTVPPGRTVNA